MTINYKDKIYEVEKDTEIKDILKNEIENSKFPVIGAKFNNQYRRLDYKVIQDGKIDLIDISTKQGMKIYRSTLIFIMAKAFEEVDSNIKLRVNYQLTNSMFCSLDNTEVTEDLLEKVSTRMKEIIDKKLKIDEKNLTRKEAQELYEKEDSSRGRLQLNIEDNPIVDNTCLNSLSNSISNFGKVIFTL